ncbi:hypothetical protein BGZ73_001968 [Actinomortierella ambigua]|nr:hypothetical protein BGZ73_001968 [Actinomortierella ambigua]
MPRSHYYGRPSRRLILGGMVMLSILFLLVSLPQPEWDERISGSRYSPQDSTNAGDDIVMTDGTEMALSMPIKNTIEKISWYAHVASARARKHIQKGLNKISMPTSNDRDAEQLEVNRVMTVSDGRDEKTTKNEMQPSSKAREPTVYRQKGPKVSKSKDPDQVKAEESQQGEEGVCLSRQAKSCEGSVADIKSDKLLSPKNQQDGEKKMQTIEYEQVEATDEAETDEVEEQGLEEQRKEERLAEAAAELEAMLEETERAAKKAQVKAGDSNRIDNGDDYSEDDLAPEERVGRGGPSETLDDEQ